MGVDIYAEKISKKLAKRKERARESQELNKDMYFYYLREKDRQIFGGVCLKKVDGVWCRGISLLSTKDRFDKDTAKRVARSRLMRAINTKEDDFPVNHEASEPSYLLYHYYQGFVYKISGGGSIHKSKYNAELTDAEKRTVAE